MQILARNFNHTNLSFTIVIQTDLGVTPFTVDKNNEKYSLLLEAYNKQDAELFLKYYNSENTATVLIEKCTKGTGITVDDNGVYYNGTKVDSRYANRILDIKSKKLPITAMVNFLENLLKNPSNRSIEELPDFLENRNMPLTEDGCFLAYKSVRGDYWSKASGKLKLVLGQTDDSGHIYNGVGETIRCSRSEVDDERGNECSHGLHVGGLQYSGPGGAYNSYGDKVVIVKVNPADVVSVPKDHNAQKVRVCAYQVIGEYVAPLPTSAVKTDNYMEESSSDWDDDWYEDEEDSYEIAVSDIDEGDVISFDYPDRVTGKIERRKVVVEVVRDKYITGFVLEGDPSYDVGEERRNFSVSKIENVTLD